MGISRALEYFYHLVNSHNHKTKKTKKVLQTVELKVKMDCDGCELKVKKALCSMKGVKSVQINRKENKATVTGYVHTKKVIKQVNSTGKKAEIWPYVHSLVVQPYITQAYDKKAPTGYVRRVEAVPTGTVVNQDDPYITMFSDENPNACAIM